LLSLVANLAGTLLVLLTGNPGPGELAGNFFGLAIAGFILYLLLSQKGAMVFSPEYAAIVARTSHVKYRTGLLVRIVVVTFVVVIVLMMLAAVIAMIAKGPN
jgi:hypothetical protein